MDVIDLDCHSVNSDYSPGPRGFKRSRSRKILSRADCYQRRSTSPWTASTAPEASRDAMPPQYRRFAGDGLDFRRPSSTSGQQSSVHIDLTGSDEEDGGNTITSYSDVRPRRRAAGGTPSPIRNVGAQRAPRYDRQIFNSEDDSDQSSGQRLGAQGRPPSPPAPILNTARSTPDWMQSRQLPRLPGMPRLRDEAQHGTRTLTPEVISLDVDETEEVAFLYERQTAPRPTLASHRPPPNPSRTAAILSRQNSARTTGMWQRQAAAAQQQQLFDFTRPAFDYFGYRPQSPEQAPEPPRPVHAELPPCLAGFTRSPREGDNLVCPCCSIELSMDDDSRGNEAAGELWVVKNCGHVYCGSCARSRPKKDTRKNKAAVKHNHFTTCLVKDCGEKVTGKAAMVQLFL